MTNHLELMVKLMAKQIDITKDLYLCSPLLNKKCSKENCYINNGCCCHTVKKEYSQEYLFDYITNLQEQLEVSQTNEGTYRLEMLDITKILGLDEHTTFDEVKEYATNLQEENEGLHIRIKTIKRRRKEQTAKIRKYREEITNKQNSNKDYKARIDKAIEYIEKGNKHFKENYNEPYEYAFMVNADEIMKILKGKSDE